MRPKRSYSVTADVLAFQSCSIQYGMFKGRRYEPATTPQLFWGTAIHQVLDKAHNHYRGLIGPKIPGTFPTDADIERYFREVETALRLREVSTGRNISDQALEILIAFNRLEGPTLYPRVLDTECRLETDRGTYILQGTVDVLRRSDEDPNGVEIWDYKGTSCPGLGEPEYERYEFQMRVYAELYYRRSGTYPRGVALYFLNELKGIQPGAQRPVNAVMRLDIAPGDIEAALAGFDQTVAEIQGCRERAAWPDPATRRPLKNSGISFGSAYPFSIGPS